jgi:Ca-activated chloride channel family protein
MPSFAQPAFLFLLLLVPPLLYHWRRSGRARLRFSDTGLVAGLPPGRSRRALWGGLALRGGGLALLIMALAGPRWPDAGTRLPTEGIAIAIVLDVSASMNERDFVWQDQAISRLEAVKNVFRLFVAGGETPGGDKLSPRSQDLIGLVTFATQPETACPLTLDHAALLKILDGEEARTLATEATTNPGDGIAWALVSLEKAPTRRKVLIFLTDGENNVPPPALKPREAAQLAGNLDIPIYAIGAGPEFVPPDKSESSDQEPTNNAKADGAVAARKTLQDIAHISRGAYFQAADGKSLADACSRIDELERTRIVSFQYRRYHEGFTWFAVAALVSWLLVLGLESTRWRRVP